MNQTLLQQRLIGSLDKNRQIVAHILQGVSQAQAAQWRDGADGWSVLEVVCHLHDYDAIFQERGELMIAHDDPLYPVYDHLALVVEHAYNEQTLSHALAAFNQSRQRCLSFFQNLNQAQWQRTGQHATFGSFTMTALAAHVAWHDVNHIEQITRILAQHGDGVRP